MGDGAWFKFLFEGLIPMGSNGERGSTYFIGVVEMRSKTGGQTMEILEIMKLLLMVPRALLAMKELYGWWRSRKTVSTRLHETSGKDKGSAPFAGG